MTRPARCRRGKSTLSALPQFWSCARIGLAALLIIQPGTQTMAYEEPEYQVVRVYQDFEIRRYLPQLVAETVVDGEFSDVGGQAFRILAGYISGNNRNGEKISMTAPVVSQQTTPPAPWAPWGRIEGSVSLRAPA